MTIFSGLGLLLLVALNAAFVAAEFAFIRVRRDQLEENVKDKKFGAAAALKAINNLDDSLAACQLGITMTSIGIGFIGESALGSVIEPWLEGPLGDAAAPIVGLIIAYIIVTGVHITVGEQVPKLYALQRSNGTARAVAKPLIFFHALARPFVALLSGITRLCLRALGVKAGSAGHEDELPGSAELDSLIVRAQLAGRLDPLEADMLSGVIDLHERQARQVMTPFFDVAFIQEDSSIKEALTESHRVGHSRLLVKDENTATIGMVHVADLSWELVQKGQDAPLNGCVRDLLIVPETKALDELLKEMRGARVSMALVADEFGQPAGIVTIEDIIEEVVGEISDETDVAEEELIVVQSDGRLLVAGHAGLHDLSDTDLPDWTDSQDSTIGGLTFSLLGRLPEVGDEVVHDGHVLQVKSMDENRIAEILICLPGEDSVTDNQDE